MTKSPGYLLLLFVALVLRAVAQTSPATDDRIARSSSEDPAKLSPTTAQLLTAKLPKYTPPAAAQPVAAKPDPDVVELPKMTITQKKRPRLNEQVMMTTKAFNEKLAKEKMGAFDRNLLNRFASLGPYTAAERARAEYNYEQHEEMTKDILRMAKITEVTDPAQAKVLRDAVSKP